MRRICFTMLLTVAAFELSGSAALQSTAPRVEYDIVYVRALRAGDTRIVGLPEVMDPIRMEPGADLVLLHPDGREEVLVEGGNGAIVDPVVSFDAQWVYYARFHDLRPAALNTQRRSHASRAGSDIFKINLKTRQIVRLTNQEWTPNTGAAEWSDDPATEGGGRYSLGYGIFNLGPCPLPDGRLMFTSSRNGFLPNRDYTFPNLQLFVMDESGKNVEQVGHLNLGSALHPSVLTDGRVMYASYESQGVRDKRLWGLWAIFPDGRNWAPLMSAFTVEATFHSHAQLTNGDIAVTEYYNLNNNGFGTLLAFPSSVPAATPSFGAPAPGAASNPRIRVGHFKKYPFSPFGLYSLTMFAHGEDNAAIQGGDGTFAGKVMHPSGAPANDVLVVWSPGPANSLARPTIRPIYDAGIYIIADGKPVDDHRKLLLVKNSPDYNELYPRAVAPYRQIYGVDEPKALAWLPNDGSLSTLLPAGTPFGLVGTSTFYKRDSAPGVGVARFNGLDAFNTAQNGASSNWSTQGSDAGRYSSDDIYAVRILAMEPTSHRSYGPAPGNGFRNHANERLRVLGEIPLRKTDASGQVVRDVDGNPDTSFLARIPADVPFTFQTLDKNGLALNTSQTWHQVRPGEIRNDCGGCHAHSQIGTDFATTAAARPDYKVADLTRSTPMLTKDASRSSIFADRKRPVDVEYYRDIKPILERSCVACHSLKGRQEARLALDDTRVVDGYEGTYERLAADQSAKYGIPPVLRNHEWRQTNASRYIRSFQSRRSLLIWKIFGQRLDGWSNSDFPTESTPGDPKTLPVGADPSTADLDYSGAPCPPPGAGVPALTDDEKMMFARWVDLGAPISSPHPAFRNRGWFQDDLRPTLTVSLPRRGTSTEPLTLVRVGAFDYYSGLDPKSLSIKASFAINGKGPRTELAPLFSETEDHVWTLKVSPPLTLVNDGVITVSVKDLQGNITKLERSFTVRAR